MRIDISYNEESEKWVVEETVSLVIEDVTLTIPQGFESDMASIPRVLWVIYPPFGKYGEPAIVHDYLYKSRHVSRKEADCYFLYLMKLNGVGSITRKAFYYMVRTFGWLYY